MAASVPIPKRIIQSLTAPAAKIEAKNQQQFDTVIAGMGPVGLVAGLAALSRGESVAFITDRDVTKGLGVRPQILSINDDSFTLIESLLSKPVKLPDIPENINTDTGQIFATILDKYVYHAMIIKNSTSSTYQFSLGNLEKALLELLHLSKANGAKVTLIEVDRIDKDLISRLTIDRHEVISQAGSGMKVNEETINDMKALRQRQDVDIERCTFTISGVKKIDGQSVGAKDNPQQLKFHNLQICNGQGQSIEKGMLEVGGDNLRLNAPILPYHAAVVFKLKDISAMEMTEVVDGVAAGHLDVTPESIDTLAALGWESGARPHTSVFSAGLGLDQKGAKQADQFYIGCQIPKKLYDEYNDKATHAQAERDIRKYAYLLLRDKIPREICQEQVESSDVAMSVSPFKLEFHQLDRSIIPSSTHLAETGVPGSVAFFGDGMMSPLYTTATGLQTGLTMVKHFHAAQLKLKVLKKTPTEKEAATILQEYHMKSANLLLQVGELQEKWLIINNKKNQTATLYKNMFDTVEGVHHDLKPLLDGFKTTMSTSSGAPVSVLFKSDTLPLTVEEKKELNEIMQKLENLRIKNKKTLLEYDVAHLFVPSRLPYKNPSQCIDEFISVSDRLTSIAEKIADRAPGILVPGQETPERFALRKINVNITGLSRQIQATKKLISQAGEDIKPSVGQIKVK